VNGKPWSRKPSNFDIRELVKKFSNDELFTRPWEEQTKIAYEHYGFWREFQKSASALEQTQKFITMFRKMRETDHKIEYDSMEWLINLICKKDEKLKDIYSLNEDYILNKLSYLERHFRCLATCTRKDVTPRCLRRRARKAAQA
jgi:hypothetical protein